MDKTNVENVMSIAFELARIREKHGAQSDVYLSEVRALRAEVERLAAQAAPIQKDRVAEIAERYKAEVAAGRKVVPRMARHVAADKTGGS